MNNYERIKAMSIDEMAENEANEIIAELKAKNDKLKEKLHELKCPFYFKHTAICLGRKDDMQRYEKCTSYQNCNIKQMAKNNKNYYQALQEIKAIAEYSIMHNGNLNSNYQQILRIITKAESEEE